ncbi:MAG: PKD domain-containing protein, partial [Actinobacteria bacterium]
SIVLGSTNGTTVGGEASVADPSATFVSPGAEDFHLRAHAPEIDQGHSGQGGEIAQDVDGDARPFGSAWDLGADEFVEHAPFISLAGASSGTILVGRTLYFGVVGEDPDPGDSVAYHWTFGDGGGANGATAAHVFAAPGAYTARVTATDTYGRTATATVPVRVVSSSLLSGDRTPPRVSIATPRPGQRLRERRTVPGFRGRVADDSGVRSVELALFRRRGRGCLWFDGRRRFRAGSCSRPLWFRALINDFAWGYSFSRSVRPAPGPYSLEIRATDIVGNRTARVSARTRTLVAFRFTR